MAPKSRENRSSDGDLRRLLKRYRCPMPFHAVRAYLLGNIASPRIATRPLKSLEDLWGGELPEFESMDEANELINALVNGLWNRLSRHQSRRHPFRLTLLQPPKDRDGIRQFAETRVEEIDAFIDGLFDDEEALDLPESAHGALMNLGEIRSFFGAFLQFADDHESAEAVGKSVRNMQQLTLIGSREINNVVLGCTRARRAAMKTMRAAPPTRH